MKSILKNVRGRVWLIVTAVVVTLLLVVSILASTAFFSLACLFLGEPKVEIVGEEQSAFKKDFTNKKDALANGNKVGKEICEEGYVLLKNNNSALPFGETERKVSIFGKNSSDVAIGGSGSGGSVGAKATTIFESLTSSGFTFNPTLKAFYDDNTKSGEGRDANNSDLDTGGEVTLKESFVGETPITSYTDDIWASCNDYKDAALIVITRIGGEGADLPRTENDHILKLRQNEKDLIEKVKTIGFKKVVILLNVATTMEIKELQTDEKIDAILWIGFGGGNGMTALGEILKGETLEGEKLSPSGRTVDTWAADFTHNPTWENFGAALGGDAYLTTAGKKGQHAEPAYFVDYEESIYVGYRFYETAYAESLNGNADMGGYTFDYANEVVYPFGYGLSYSTFEWTLENYSEISGKKLDKTTALNFKVKVKNTGDYPAREVVELYVSAPYKKNGIEKVAKVLVGFAKTKVLNKNEEQTVEITVDSPYDFASYDYKDANKNGFCGYEVEKGEYKFILGKNSHEEVSEVKTVVENDLRYEKDPVTGGDVVNRYTDMENANSNSDKELKTLLTRSDWKNTWPARRTVAEKKVDDRREWLDSIVNTKETPNRPTFEDVMPVTNAMNSITLSDLTGVDYNDEKWDLFLDQLTVSEMSNLVNKGAFNTGAIERLGVPRTIACDGPVGFCNFLGGTSIYETCVYPCEAVIASTWNIDRLYDMGLALGNEALVGDIKNGGTPYTGWYAPGLNIHRSPFGGRNFEYYSEDSYLSGKMTAAILKGLAEKGVYADMKHFAVNEQETHRSLNGLCTWVTEQSMREIYLKGFEIAIKTAKKDGVKAMGVMSSFNRIGERWAGGDYRLLTEILRNEWGFTGLVICDFNTCSHMMVKDMVYAGGDLNLELAGFRQYVPNAKNASDVVTYRLATKNILYVIANSNAMRGEFRMTTPLWQILMFVIDGVVAVGLAVWGYFAITASLRSKENA